MTGYTTEWRRDRGEANLVDLAPVCETHHHAVHEGGCHLELTADRVARWTRPDGTLHWEGTTIDRVGSMVA